MTPGDERNPHQLPGSAPSRSGRALPVVAVGLVLVSGLAGVFAARWMKPNRTQAEVPVAPGIAKGENEEPKPAARYFRDWDKPDFVLVLTGSQHGYLLPCGCSSPQLGGLERRYNFIQSLKKRGWPVAAVDVGDIAQLRGPRGLANEQGLLKYVYSMRALKQTGYAAVSLGEYEAGLPLETALAEYALQDPVPRVLVANLLDHEKTFPGMIDEWKEIKGLPIKTGVTAILGPTVFGKVDNANANLKLRFEEIRTALKRVVSATDKARLEFRILLYQGLATNHAQQAKGAAGAAPKAAEAVQCAERWPQFQVVLGLAEEEEPSSRPLMTNNDNTLVASVGFKGRYIGVVGVWRTKKPDHPFRMAYELVEMGEDLVTPPEQVAGHPVLSLIEDYTAELKQRDMLARFVGQPTRHRLQVLDPVKGLTARTPSIPTYVGSETCNRCHKDAYTIWKGSKHSHAYDTLVAAKRPSLRQFDAECIVCHTTGFGNHTGFASADKTPKLKAVGCESCHGPGSHHAMNPNNETWRERMNEWKAPLNETPAQKIKRLGRVNEFCMTCHDQDNDVHWTHNALDRNWPKIAHGKD